MFVWRNIRAGRNSIGSVILPDAYFSEGDAQTHCDVIYANTSTQRLAFCEDAVFWDAPTDHGEAKRRVLISCDNNRYVFSPTQSLPIYVFLSKIAVEHCYGA